MSLFAWNKNTVTPPNDSKNVLVDYQRLRSVGVRLSNKLVSRLSRDALYEGAKKLGFLRGGKFVFENEDESSVLMDYCIYNVYRQGRNAIDEYVSECAADHDSDEMTCLHAMQHATYVLIAVLGAEPGVGCHVRNLYTDEKRLLADVGLSKTTEPGFVFASRLLDFGDFVSTGGAALPFGTLTIDQLEEWRLKMPAAVGDDYDPATLIRSLLANGASQQVRYMDLNLHQLESTIRRSEAGHDFPSRKSSSERKRLSVSLNNTAVTNRRCKCGSGKMHKNCCGKG